MQKFWVFLCILLNVFTQENREIELVFSNFPPYLICNGEISFSTFLKGETTSNFKGILFEIAQKIFQNLEGNFSNKIKCVNQTSFKNENSGIYIGNFQYSLNHTFDRNLTPSQPLLLTGLKIITINNQTNIWSFLSPLSYESAGIILIIGLIIAIFIWLFEENKWKQSLFAHIFWLNVMIKEVFGSIFIGNSVKWRLRGSKLLIWSFWFMFLLFLMQYVIFLSINIRWSYNFDQTLKPNFMTDNFGILQNDFQIYNYSLMPTQVNDNLIIFNDFENMFDRFLRKKDVSYLLVDYPSFHTYSTNYTNQLRLLQDFYVQSSIVAILHGDFSFDFQLKFSKEILNYKKSVNYKEKSRLFFQGGFQNTSNNNFVNYSISTNNLIGIWIFLIATIIWVGFVIISLKINKFHENFYKKINENIVKERGAFRGYNENEFNKEIENDFEETFTNGISSNF